LRAKSVLRIPVLRAKNSGFVWRVIARLATITNLSKEYEAEVQRINALYEAGAISATQRAQQIMSAQQQELNGLAKLKVEYSGYEKELKSIEKRMKTQVEGYKQQKQGVGGLAGAFMELKSGGLAALGPIGVAAAGVLEAMKALVAGIREGIKAYQEQEISVARLNAVLKATGAEAWTTSRQLQELADAQSTATGRSTDELMQMQAVMLGFRSITGEVFTEATDAIIQMSGVMGGDVVASANAFGKALDTPIEGMATLSRYGFVFSEQEKELIKELERAGEHEKAQRIVLDAMTGSFGQAATAINNVVKSQTDYNTAIYNFKKLAGELANAVITPIRDTATAIAKFYTEGINGIRNFIDAQRRLKDNSYELTIEGNIQEFNDQITVTNLKLGDLVTRRSALASLPFLEDIGVLRELDDQIDNVNTNLAAWRQGLVNLEAEQKKIQDAAAEEARNAAINEENAKNQKDAINAIMALEHKYQENIAQTQDLRKRGFIEELESYQAFQDARMQEINGLEELRATLLRVQEERRKNGEGLTGDEIAQLQLITTILDRQTNQYKELNLIIGDNLIQQEIDKSLIEDQIKAQDEAYEAENKRYKADEALEAIAKRYAEQLEDQQVILNHQLGTEEDRIAKEKELLELERQRAIEQLMNSEEYNDATGEDKSTIKQDAIDALNAYFDAAAEGIEKIKDGVKGVQPQLNLLQEALQNAFGEDWGKAIYQGLQQLPSIVSSVASLITEEVNREAKKRQKILDDELKESTKALKDQHQQRLVDAGLASAETEAQYEAELEAALRTGDEVMVYKARQALEKAQIDQEYADEQQRIEEETAKKKAQIQYEAEMTAWKLKLLSATASGAMAVVNAYATPPFPVGLAMGALATTLTGLQIASVAAAKPELSYQTGGIVPGNSFTGDNMRIRVNSGEGIFTEDQMKAMGLMINQQGSGQEERPILLTVVYQLDTIEVGRQTFKAANNGHYFLKERAIIR
jgi:hypothetical protein